MCQQKICYTNVLVQFGVQYCERLQVIAKNAMQVPVTTFYVQLKFKLTAYLEAECHIPYIKAFKN